MEGGQLPTLTGASFPVLEPVPYRHLQIRQAPAVIERQEGTARRDRHDGHAGRALDRPGIRDDQGAAGGELG